MSNASRGAAFERRVQDHLEELGWVVVRAAGSLGALDLVAVAPADVLFVQVRLNGRMDPVEWDGLYLLARRAGGTALLVDRPARGRIRFRHLLGLKGIGRRGGNPPCEEWTPYLVPACPGEEGGL